ncbi:unnamed protein product, partial [Rotaria sp. Silwood1]
MLRLGWMVFDDADDIATALTVDV